MAERSGSGEKTEAPTPKKRQDAVKNGDVLQSRELATALVMLGGAGWLSLAGPAAVEACLAVVRSGLTLHARDVALFDPATRAVTLIGQAALPVLLLFSGTLVAAVAGQALLGSFAIRGAAMAPKGSRIDPLAGLKRIFGANGLIELAKSLAKTLVLGALGWWLIARDLPRIVGMGRSDVAAAATMLGESVLSAVIWLSVGLALIAMIDVPVQIVRRTARLRMSKQEVLDEMRQSEGAPELKMMQRQRQRALLTGSARRAVTEANVILINPTHFAVALRYRPGEDFAPIVVARGCDGMALAIRDLAREAKVPMLEYPQLTRAIYFTARVGKPVAEDLYIAVATILAFVFNLDAALARQAAPPRVDVPGDKWFDAEGRRESLSGAASGRS